MLTYLRFMKRLIRWTAVAVVVVLVLMIVSIVTEHYIFPKLSQSSLFSKYALFQRVSENVTIINNTQEVRIYEDDALQQLARETRNSYITIISHLEERKEMESVVGNGAFVTADGVVVTYKESVLIDDEQDVVYDVFDSDGRQHSASFLGWDPFTNLVFLKIEGTNYSALRFANSDDFGAGKKVLYMGVAPSSGENRIASGIITERAYDFNISSQSVASSEKLEGVLLAQINTAYDLQGSPVMSMQGEVVGIAGKKKFDNEEVLFIIPSNDVRSSLGRLTQEGSFDRPELGVNYISLNRVAALQYDIEEESGAWIYAPSGRQASAILAGSSAAKAGLKIGDVVVGVNDREVTLSDPLSNLIQQYTQGEAVTLKVIRAQEEIDIEIQL